VLYMAIVEHNGEVFRDAKESSASVAAHISDELDLQLLDNALNEVVGSEEHQKIREIHAEITDKNNEIKKLRQEILKAKQESDRKVSIRVARVKAALANPSSSLHPIYRKVLINATEAGGSLSAPETFIEAHHLGSALVRLNHYLEVSDEAQPLVVIRNLPTAGGRTAETPLQIDYGFTEPGSGLKVFDQGETKVWHSNLQYSVAPQSWIGVTPQEQPPIHAYMQSGHNSHFTGDDQSVLRVLDDGLTVEDVLAPEDIVPELGPIKIELPSGNLYAPKEPTPFIVHDDHNGGIQEVQLPKNFGISRDNILVIGVNALQMVTETLPDQIKDLLGEEKGRVAKAMIERVIREDLTPSK
jgi:hypothetical protein